jgi:hypothetical protein
VGAPREKAVKNFVAVVCDKEIANITREKLLDFCTLWLDRIDAGRGVGELSQQGPDPPRRRV